MNKSFLSLVFLFVLILPVHGQEDPTFELSVDRSSVNAGAQFSAIINVTIAPGWHMYSVTQAPGGPVPTTIRLDSSPVFAEAGPLVAPRPHRAHDENFGIETEYYENSAEFRLPLKAAPDAPAGAQKLSVKVRYMLCSDTLCLPPQTKVLATQVTIAGKPASSTGGAGVPPKAASGPPNVSPAVPGSAGGTPPQPSGTSSSTKPSVSGQPVSGSAGQPVSPSAGQPVSPSAGQPVSGSAAPTGGQALPLGTLAYIWFSMAMGGLALLTPCVFPMIPITVSYFTKRQAVSRRQSVGEALLYSVGIVLTFTLLGFGLTFAFGAGGINRLAASPFVNLLIAAVFVLFALSLFGVLEIRVPSTWLTAVDRQSSRTGGLVGILLMALTFSLTSFTCTVPFVGTVMVAALQGDWLWSLLGVTAFATVFSAPFFLLAVFPSVLKSLPKSGNWMNSVKILMGFLEIAAALKFISNVDLVYQWELLTRPVFITVWLAIAVVAAIYLLGWFRLAHEAPAEAVGVSRMFGAIFFLAVAFYLLRGLMGFPLGELDAFLPPRDYGEVAVAGFGPSGGGTAQPGEKWLSSYSEGLEVAKRENRPVFVDFTGYTCTNCRWMESNVFPLPEVQSLFGRFVLVRLYTDGPEKEHEENLRFEKERFGTIALPFYAVMSHDDRVLATFPGLTRDPKQFVRFLENGLNEAGKSQLSDASISNDQD